MTKKTATVLFEGYAFTIAREYVKSQNGGELPQAMNGRAVTLDAFHEYVENCTDVKANLGEMLNDYITNPTPFAYESRKILAAQKREEKRNEEAEILKVIGL